MRYYIHNILIILRYALGKICVHEPQAVLLRGRKIAGIFGVLVSHIRAAFFAHNRAETRPESIAAHRIMRPHYISRVYPEIFAGVCGKVSGFLGFRKFLISRIFCTHLQGRANPSRNWANTGPESTSMVSPAACVHPR